MMELSDDQSSSAGTSLIVPATAIVTFIIILLFILPSFLLGQLTIQPRQKIIVGLARDSITIGQVFGFLGIYPKSEDNFYENIFNNNIFEGLGRISGGQVKPFLATGWTNPDDTTWRFTLREDVKFHNGDPFTAYDVKFSIETALKEGWPASFNFETVKLVEVVDDYTVDIKTNDPDPILLNRLVFAFVVSEKQFKQKNKDENAVGTGSYRFVSLDKEKAILAANENYYLGAPKVKRVIYKFYPEETTDKQLVEAINIGEVDLVFGDESDVTTFANKDVQIKTLADPFITFLFLDTSNDKSPYIEKTPNPLKNKLVRQAIYKAIDVDAIFKASSLSAIPANQFVTDAIFGYNPNIERPQPNVEEAKQLLRIAGFADGISLALDVSNPLVKEAEAIAKELSKININIRVNGVENDKFLEKVLVKKDTSAFILDYGAETYDAGEIFTAVFHTPRDNFGSNNFTGYSNLEIDKLAEEIAVTFNLRARKQKLQEATVKAVEELPIIPLFNRKFFYVISNNFDWNPTAFGAIYVNEITGRDIISN